MKSNSKRTVAVKRVKPKSSNKRITQVYRNPLKVTQVLSPLYNANIISLNRNKAIKKKEQFVNNFYRKPIDNQLLSEYIFNERDKSPMNYEYEFDLGPSTTRSTVVPTIEDVHLRLNSTMTKDSRENHRLELPYIKNKQIMIEFSPVRYAEYSETNIPIEVLPSLPLAKLSLKNNFQGAKFMLDKRLSDSLL